MKRTTNWPKNAPSPYVQERIDAAIYKLVKWCLLADIDLTYVDADGLLVKVVRPKAKRRKR